MRSLFFLGLISEATALSIAPLRPSHARLSPRMIGAPIESLADAAAAQPLFDASMLLAETGIPPKPFGFEDFFGNFPLFVTGCMIAAFGGQYLKFVKPIESDLSSDGIQAKVDEYGDKLGASYGWLVPEQLEGKLPALSLPAVNLPSVPLPEVEVPELPEFVALALIPVFAVAFVVLANTGLIGAFAGALAKALLDGWNVIAYTVLPGALLKYW